MRAMGWAALAAVCSTGCYGFSSFDDSGSGGSGGSSDPSSGSVRTGSVYETPPDRCLPPSGVWGEVRALHDAAEASVHELVTCGGMQTSLSQSMMTILIASNRDLFDEEAYADMVEFASDFGIRLEVPFESEGEGVWSMAIPTAGDSRFSLTFTDPETGERIVEDPFQLETYLTGLSATTEMSFEEMKAHPSRQNTVTFEWEDYGPLGHLLNEGEPVPNPFTMRVSLLDLGQYAFGLDLSSSEPEFGPLESILDLYISSEVRFHDERGSARVDYEAAGLRASVRNVADRGVDFDLSAVDAEQGEYTMRGSAADLRYVETGSLAGTIEYTVEGPRADLVVESDFGTGNAYPDIRWRCPE